MARIKNNAQAAVTAVALCVRIEQSKMQRVEQKPPPLQAGPLGIRA